MSNWHDMEMREVYGATLSELIAADPRVMCLEADLSKASGTNPKVAAAHPQHFINSGVAEANMIGVGAGLAIEGRIPFCATFTCFASRRVYDQVYLSVAYANTNVKLVGTSPGITQGPNGGTHMDFQDLAIMRVMPNLHLYSPCDALELRAVMRHMAAHVQPTYMQLVRSKVAPVFDREPAFDPAKAVLLREGRDVTLVSTGYMTAFAAAAVKALGAEGLSVEHLHYPSIKPFDVETLVTSARKTRAVVTVENQNIIGGLGGAVCETLSERAPTRVRRLGIPDQFGEVATEDYLFNKHGFGTEHIKAACRQMAGSKS